MAYIIEEQKTYKSDGEIGSIFYLYKPFLFFFRRYVKLCSDGGCFKRGFSTYHEAKKYKESRVIKILNYKW